MDFLNDNSTRHFLNKKMKRKKSIKKIESKDYLKETTSTKDQDIFDYSTDISNEINVSSNKIHDEILNEISFPTFLNDVTKYDNINKKIINYHKIKNSFADEEDANLYLIDINRLYEIKKKIQNKP